MFDGFELTTIETSEAAIRVRHGGGGPPVLLLHGFPQTHISGTRSLQGLLVSSPWWPLTCAGTGGAANRSRLPTTSPTPKPAMACDMVAVMERLGFHRFSVVGHDRGGRVAYRLSLDHPKRADRLAVLDIVPVSEAFRRADMGFVLSFWPWFLLAQPYPLPERLVGAAELSFFNGHYDTRLLSPAGGHANLRRRTDPAPGRHRARATPPPGAGRSAGSASCSGLCARPSRARPCAFAWMAAFAGPRLLAFLDRAGVEYLVGLPGNARLEKRVRRLLGRAWIVFRTTGQATPVFGETRYAARSWGRKRRVIMKAEVVQYPGRAPRRNPRFVVTNLAQAPEAVYAIYRQRGDVENRHKELKDSLGLGRTSCPVSWPTSFASC
jgi:pimeloyl-ACP methyl ester carboxylesterase